MFYSKLEEKLIISIRKRVAHGSAEQERPRKLIKEGQEKGQGKGKGKAVSSEFIYSDTDEGEGEDGDDSSSSQGQEDVEGFFRDASK